MDDAVGRDPRAAASVAWWRGLRASCKQALESEPVPASLARDVQRQLSAMQARRRLQFLRIGVPGLAAAVLFIAFWLWPHSVEATPVDEIGFAAIYDKCAVHLRHDSLGVRALPEGTCVSQFKCKMPFTCCVPNLATCGRYRADGGCTCSPANGMKVVHVYFRSADAPDVVISAFSTDRPIRLVRSAVASNGGRCHKDQGQQESFDDISLFAWERESKSYVLAARMPEARLRQLADSATLAAAENLLQAQGEAVALGETHP